MSRKTKFRTWSKELQWFIEMFPYDTFHVYGFNGMLALDEYVFQQFTGLYDKNENEVYEGDILKVIGSYTGETFVGVVEYIGSGFYIKIIKCGSVIQLHDRLDKSEVIGNIFETPDLLK